MVHLSLEDVLRHFEAKGHASEPVSLKCSEVNRLFSLDHVLVSAFSLPYRKYCSILQVFGVQVEPQPSVLFAAVNKAVEPLCQFTFSDLN